MPLLKSFKVNPNSSQITFQPHKLRGMESVRNLIECIMETIELQSPNYHMLWSANTIGGTLQRTTTKESSKGLPDESEILPLFPGKGSAAEGCTG